MIPRSRYKGCWVWLNTIFSEYAFKCKIIKVTREVDGWCYLVQYDNGEREPIFTSSVTRIFPDQQKKARVIDIRKKIKIVRNG